MKYTTLIFCVLGTLCANSQLKVTASSLAGYETNIYKSPSILISDGEVLNESELFASSAYQDVILNSTYSKKWTNSLFKVSLNPQLRYYFSQENAKTSIVNARVKYEFNFSRTTKWQNSLTYKVKSQNGQDLDANELSTPLGFNRWNFSSRLLMRFSKRNRSVFEVNYGNKTFDASESRQVAYNFYRLKFTTRKVKWKNGLLHSFGLNVAYSGREYNIQNIEEETNSKRNWDYINTSVFYKIPFNKKWNIEPQLEYEKRMDKTNNQFGYDEFSTSFKLKFKSKSFLFNLTSNFAYRAFGKLNTTGTTIQKLNYKYVRLNMNTSYKLNKKWLLTSRAYLISRNSNNNNINTTAYRSYHNNYFGLGLKFIF